MDLTDILTNQPMFRILVNIAKPFEEKLGKEIVADPDFALNNFASNSIGQNKFNLGVYILGVCKGIEGMYELEKFYSENVGSIKEEAMKKRVAVSF